MRVAVVGHVEWIEFVRVARMPGAGDIVHARGRRGGGSGAAGAAVVMGAGGPHRLAGVSRPLATQLARL